MSIGWFHEKDDDLNFFVQNFEIFFFLFCSKLLEKYSRQSDDFKKKSPSFATMSTDIIILRAKKKFCAELSRTYYRARQEKHKKTREIAENGIELSRNKIFFLFVQNFFSTFEKIFASIGWFHEKVAFVRYDVDRHHHFAGEKKVLRWTQQNLL